MKLNVLFDFQQRKSIHPRDIVIPINTQIVSILALGFMIYTQQTEIIMSTRFIWCHYGNALSSVRLCVRCNGKLAARAPYIVIQILFGFRVDVLIPSKIYMEII